MDVTPLQGELAAAMGFYSAREDIEFLLWAIDFALFDFVWSEKVILLLLLLERYFDTWFCLLDVLGVFNDG